MSLFDMQRRLWRDLSTELAGLHEDVRAAALESRAEIAGATAVYATVGDLPDGFLGALATVEDDGTGSPALLWHDGTTWKQVTVT